MDDEAEDEEGGCGDARAVDGRFQGFRGRIIACEMTMEVMGISRKDLDEELIDEYGAVGMYVNEAKKSETTLFI